MFDLEAQIKQWRAELARSGLNAGEVVDELEGHLRERVDRLSAGLPAEEAFTIAAWELGNCKVLKREFSRAKGFFRFWHKNPPALNTVGGWMILMGLNCLSQVVWLAFSDWPWGATVWLWIGMWVCLFMSLQIAVGIGLLCQSRILRFCAFGFLAFDCCWSVSGLIHYFQYSVLASYNAIYIFVGIPVSLRFEWVTDIASLGMSILGFYLLTRPAVRNLFRPTFAG